MPKQLTTQNAMITTATVEVKTLTVSGKQVTLAVFRQLREEPLIGDDGDLKGDPWGYVNYHPDKCEGSHWDHRHVIWQRGGELLRCRVDGIAPFDRPGARFRNGATDEYAVWLLTEWAHGRLDWCPLARHPVAGSSIREQYFCRWKAHGMSVEGGVEGLVQRETVELVESAKYRLDRAQRDYDKYAGQLQTQDLAKAQDAIAGILTEFDAYLASIGPTERIQVNCGAAVTAEVAHRDRKRASRASLAELPQMFIAV